MGAKLTAAQADEWAVWQMVPSVFGLLAAIGIGILCTSLNPNKETVGSRILLRIAASIGMYSFVSVLSPHEDMSLHTQLMPVIQARCYTQSVVLIFFENLTYGYQCAMMHNLHEIVALKNLRPELLLPVYDSWAVVGAVAMSLIPWSLNGYGWEWIARCKYNVYASGIGARILTQVLHVACMGYVFVIGAKMTWASYLHRLMIIDPKMKQSAQRHEASTTKFITLTWAWAFCNVLRIATSCFNVIHYLAQRTFAKTPDDFPFGLVVVDALVVELMGIVMLMVLLTWDGALIYTRTIKKIQCMNQVYCLSRQVNFESEARAMSAKVVQTAVEKEARLQETFGCLGLSKAAMCTQAVMEMPANLNPASPAHSPSLRRHGDILGPNWPFFKKYASLEDHISPMLSIATSSMPSTAERDSVY